MHLHRWNRKGLKLNLEHLYYFSIQFLKAHHTNQHLNWVVKSAQEVEELKGYSEFLFVPNSMKTGSLQTFFHFLKFFLPMKTSALLSVLRAWM